MATSATVEPESDMKLRHGEIREALPAGMTLDQADRARIIDRADTAVPERRLGRAASAVAVRDIF